MPLASRETRLIVFFFVLFVFFFVLFVLFGFLRLLSLFLPPGRVAGYAVLEVLDSFLQVFVLDFGRVVLVAIVTVIALDGLRVTGSAGVPSISVIYREGVGTGVLSWSPGIGAVTGSAVGAQPRMERRFRMAGRALLGGALEDPIGVTLGAIRPYVGTGEGEGGFGVVEGSLLPPIGCMTLGTILSETALVGVIGLVAGLTPGIYGLIPHLAVAIGAG